MRSLGDPSFFRVFDAMVAEARTLNGTRRTAWSHAGAEWTFERLSSQGLAASFAIETYTLANAAGASWRLIVAREYWWSGEEALRDSRWAKVLSGSRGDVMEWLRSKEREMRGAGAL